MSEYCVYEWFCEHFDKFADGDYDCCLSCEWFVGEDDE